MERIQSVQNPKVKSWMKLQTKKGRDQEGTFLIEGLHMAEEAIQSHAVIEALLIEEEFETNRLIESFISNTMIPVYSISKQVLNKLTQTEMPQGICAIIRKNEDKYLDLLQGQPIILMLDAIQDPGNLGTMIRTADAAGISAVVLGKGTVDPYNAKVLRSTMGSIFHIPVMSDVDLKTMIIDMRLKGFSILAASLEGAVSYNQPHYCGPVAILIGNEANGVSTELLEMSSVRTKIPIYGQAESLNAAIAAGIIMYEAVRQRQELQE